MTREEIIDFCDMKAQLEPENEDIFKAIIKALEQETVSKESYDHEYFLRKEFEIKIARLEHILDKVRAEIKQYQSDYDVHGTEYDRTAWKAFNRCLQIIDKYKGESEDKK